MISENKESRSNTVRGPVIDGSDAQHQKWWLRFKAHAKIAGFGKALKVDPEACLPDAQEEVESLTATETHAVLKKKAADRNDKAVARFALAFETDDLFNLATETQSKEWPDGLVWKITK